ncbi:MAG: DUF4174 domain-containing protein [Spirochaetota bacterium]
MSNPIQQWIDRPVVVVFAAAQDDPDYLTMIDRIYHHRRALEERGVLVITVSGMRVTIDGESTTAFTPSELRRMLEVQSHGFALIVLGDDGSERTRRFEPLTMEELLSSLGDRD